MEVNCAGCAGCCLDWRPLTAEASDHERRGPHEPLDDRYNLVPLTRDDVRAFLDAGLADALTPRLWSGDDADGVEVDGHVVAAIEGRPAFFVGLRQPPKPVGPFGTDPAWLDTCVFLDPTTLQCRIHSSPVYPAECADYPGHNLDLGAETECERVEAAYGGDRLLERSVPDDLSPPLFGPQAVGQKLFVHPEPARIAGTVSALVDGEPLRAADRAEFVAVAAASAPGTTHVNPEAYDRALERAHGADSWAGRAIDEWTGVAGRLAPEPGLADRIEVERGAPPTPGWSIDAG